MYGNHNEKTFDSWMGLCELTIDLAINEAQSRQKKEFDALVDLIADEMIATSYSIPVEPESNDGD